MAVPDFQTLMKPVLETLAKGGQRHVRRELVPEVAERLGLSSEDMAETIPLAFPGSTTE